MNPLNYNRYTYVLNNPLKYTDPSGYTYYKFTGNGYEAFEWDPFGGDTRTFQEASGGGINYKPSNEALGYTYVEGTEGGTYVNNSDIEQHSSIESALISVYASDPNINLVFSQYREDEVSFTGYQIINSDGSVTNIKWDNPIVFKIAEGTISNGEDSWVIEIPSLDLHETSKDFLIALSADLAVMSAIYGSAVKTAGGFAAAGESGLVVIGGAIELGSNITNGLLFYNATQEFLSDKNKTPSKWIRQGLNTLGAIANTNIGLAPYVLPYTLFDEIYGDKVWKHGN